MEISNDSIKQYDHLRDWFHEGKMSGKVDENLRSAGFVISKIILKTV